MENWKTLISSFYKGQSRLPVHGTTCRQATALIQEIGRRITAVKEQPWESTFLFQRLSIAFQRGTWLPSRERSTQSKRAVRRHYLLTISSSLRLCGLCYLVRGPM